MTDHKDDDPSTAPPARRAKCSEANGTSAAALGVDARRRIGRDLRLLYGTVFDQPLPERFTRLIDELATGSSHRKGS